MLDSTKVYTVISSLDRKTLNRLEKFIQSPYFNVNDKISGLFDEIYNCLKGDGRSIPSKQEIWASLYGEQKYVDQKFRKLCSDLLRLTEKFLAQQIYEENPLYQASYLVEAVSKNHLEVLYNSVMSTARRLSERQLEKSASFYYYLYQIERFYYDITESEIKREDRLNVEEINQNLDNFYMSEKLRYYCTALSQKRFLHHDYEIPFIDNILEHLGSISEESIPHILLYHHMYQIYSDEHSYDSYPEFKRLIFMYITSFPKSEAHDIMNAAINYCIHKMNLGESEYRYEIFELYKYALKEELIYINDEITPSTFRNIVVVALRLRDYRWAENFIEDFKERLNLKYRDNTVVFNKSQVYFYKKDYEKVLELLREVEIEDVSMNFQAKSILLATYYELDEYSALDSLLDSFKTLINRKKKLISQSRKKNYSNLIRFVKKLLNTPSNDRSRLNELKQEILDEPSIASKAWLLEKFEELGI